MTSAPKSRKISFTLVVLSLLFTLSLPSEDKLTAVLVPSPPFSSPVVVILSDSNEDVFATNLLTILRIANAPCLCTSTLFGKSFIAVRIADAPLSCTIRAALLGFRNAIAASDPQPCSCIVALFLYSCMAFKIDGRADGKEPEVLSLFVAGAEPRQSVVLISSLPHKLRIRPITAAVNCFFCDLILLSVLLLFFASLLCTVVVELSLLLLHIS
mmetsp:Transcript_11182/g.12964  ORF Transcript_11182/g.12964 Transcript_11182/m.12964 type:complete len:213 (-) Transcript_11182:70-708(-)